MTSHRRRHDVVLPPNAHCVWIIVEQGPIVLAVDGGYLDIFFRLLLSLFFLSGRRLDIGLNTVSKNR